MPTTPEQTINATTGAVDVINNAAIATNAADATKGLEAIPYFSQIRAGITLAVGIASYFYNRAEKKKEEKKARIERAKVQAEKDANTLKKNQDSFTSTEMDVPIGIEADQRILVGEVETNGIEVLFATSGPYLIRDFYLSSAPVENYMGMSLDGNELDLGTDGYAYNEPFYKRPGTAANDVYSYNLEQRQTGRVLAGGFRETIEVQAKKYFIDGDRKYVRVSSNDGVVRYNNSGIRHLANVDPILRHRLNIPSNYQLLNCAHVVIEQYRGPFLRATEAQLIEDYGTELLHNLAREVENVFPGGRAGSPRFKVQSLKCWDMRDPLQKKDDPSTWKYTNNAAIVIPTVMQLREFTNGQVNFDMFDIQSIIDSANVCDSFIKKANGREINRFTLNGIIQTSEAPYAVIQRMLNCCGGDLPFREGKYSMDIFGPRKVCDTITDEDLLNRSWAYSPLLRDSQQFSKVKPTFNDMSQSGLGKATSAPIVTLTNSSSNNYHNPEYSFTSDPDRAEFLAATEAREQKYQKRFTFPMDLTGIKYQTGDVVNYHSNTRPSFNETYYIDSVEINKEESSTRLSLSQFSNDIFVNTQDVITRPYLPQPIIDRQPNISAVSSVVDAIREAALRGTTQ